MTHPNDDAPEPAPFGADSPLVNHGAKPTRSGMAISFLLLIPFTAAQIWLGVVAADNDVLFLAAGGLAGLGATALFIQRLRDGVGLNPLSLVAGLTSGAFALAVVLRLLA